MPPEHLRRDLLAWYDRHRRDLPWRAAPGETTDPYRVWLSEIMLQQTTVAHATRYFREFTRRWPTVGALAAAPEAEVMAAWAGLGYYARARNLIACGRSVANVEGGRFPRKEAELRALPGVGAYTAAAITTIAFDAPANVVDANVERVIARLNAVEEPLPSAKPKLRALAADLVRTDRPGDWAQALMDLGATICRPTRPLCDQCPLSACCKARATGAPASYPRKTRKAERPQRFGVAYVIRRGGDVAVVRRPARGLLGGMLGLPTSGWTDEPDALADADAWTDHGAVHHVFTHFALTLRVLAAELPDAFATRASTHPPNHRTAGFQPAFFPCRLEAAGPAEGAAVTVHWMPADVALAAMPTLFKKALRRVLD